MTLLDYVIAKRADEDIEIWHWLHDVVERLGCDGTSSDESDADQGMIVYQVKRLPWRRDIEKELDIIDALRMNEPEAYAPQGSKPLRRIRGAENPVSLRKPVEGLPKSFYDADWFKDAKDPAFKGAVSRTKFKWMNIIATPTRRSGV
jgi:hypothetical protein